MASGTFACYRNFVDCSDRDGSPRHSKEDRRAVRQLVGLLRSVAASHACAAGVDVDRAPIVLVGFSKGAVVLNQVGNWSSSCCFLLIFLVNSARSCMSCPGIRLLLRHVSTIAFASSAGGMAATRATTQDRRST